MKRLRVLILALITASTLAVGTGSAFANPNGTNQNGTCQNNPLGGNQNPGVPGQGCHT
jgi:hypothetical protein